MPGACCRAPRLRVGYVVVNSQGDCLIVDDDGCAVFRTAALAMRAARAHHPAGTWQLEKVVG